MQYNSLPRPPYRPPSPYDAPPLYGLPPLYDEPGRHRQVSRNRVGPYEEPYRGQYVRKRGPMTWWLNMAAPPRRVELPNPSERERIRRAEITGYMIATSAVFLLLVLLNGHADPSTIQAIIVMAAVLTITTVLNRTGERKAWHTAVAGFLVPALLLALLMFTIVQAQGGLRLIWLPTYDLLALAILVSSVNGTWRTPWIFFVAIVGFIVGDFLLQPHALINAVGATNFDDIAYETSLVGVWGMINRPIGLCLAAAIAGSISAYSVERALRRADRAEELAGLEHTLAEQKRQLDEGVQQILQTHVRAANGDYSARAPLSQDNVLWQIAYSLNNLLNRLQRAGQVGQNMRRAAQPWVQEPFPTADPLQPRGGFPGGGQRHNWQEQMSQMPPPQQPAPWPNAAQPRPAPVWSDQMAPAPQPGQQNGGRNGGWPMPMDTTRESPMESWKGEPAWPEQQDENPQAFPFNER
jgi:hypothetical protein